MNQINLLDIPKQQLTEAELNEGEYVSGSKYDTSQPNDRGPSVLGVIDKIGYRYIKLVGMLGGIHRDSAQRVYLGPEPFLGGLAHE